MVSDFIDEHRGYLALSDHEYEEARANHSGLWKSARFLLKYGSSSEGYWNREKFLIQVKQALTIGEINILHRHTASFSCSTRVYRLC